jgi:hypothetical protein
MSANPATRPDTAPELSLVLIRLFKGPLYRDTHERLWAPLLRLRAAVSDHVAVLGLVVEVDESEGYAYLRSRPPSGDGDEPELPRLVARQPLSFPVSVLLALLRKRLAEFDAQSADPRLVLHRDQIADMLRIFLAEAGNEARVVDLVDAHINTVVRLGFLRRLGPDSEEYEVRRLIKAFVDAQWLSSFDERLDGYLAEHAEATTRVGTR